MFDAGNEPEEQWHANSDGCGGARQQELHMRWELQHRRCQACERYYFFPLLFEKN